MVINQCCNMTTPVVIPKADESAIIVPSAPPDLAELNRRLIKEYNDHVSWVESMESDPIFGKLETSTQIPFQFHDKNPAIQYLYGQCLNEACTGSYEDVVNQLVQMQKISSVDGYTDIAFTQRVIFASGLMTIYRAKVVIALIAGYLKKHFSSNIIVDSSLFSDSGEINLFTERSLELKCPIIEVLYAFKYIEAESNGSKCFSMPKLAVLEKAEFLIFVKNTDINTLCDIIESFNVAE